MGMEKVMTSGSLGGVMASTLFHKAIGVPLNLASGAKLSIFKTATILLSCKHKVETKHCLLALDSIQRLRLSPSTNTRLPPPPTLVC